MVKTFQLKTGQQFVLEKIYLSIGIKMVEKIKLKKIKKRQKETQESKLKVDRNKVLTRRF